MHKKAIKDKCRETEYKCNDFFLQNIEDIMSCPGGEENSTFFGLQPSTFGGSKGYADFLSAIADNTFLMRENRLMKTDSFIQSATQNARVVMIFYTPISGLVTCMRVSFVYVSVFGNLRMPNLTACVFAFHYDD